MYEQSQNYSNNKMPQGNEFGNPKVVLFHCRGFCGKILSIPTLTHLKVYIYKNKFRSQQFMSLLVLTLITKQDGSFIFA